MRAIPLVRTPLDANTQLQPHSGPQPTWQQWLGIALAVLMVLLTLEGLTHVLTLPTLGKQTGGFLRMVADLLHVEKAIGREPVLRFLFVLIAVVSVVSAGVGAWVLARAGESAAARQAGWLLVVCAVQGFGAFFVGSLARYSEWLPLLRSDPDGFYFAALFAMVGYFFFGLARFLVLFPRSVETMTILQALPLGSRLRGLSDIDAVLPSIARWHRSLLSGRALFWGALFGAVFQPFSAFVSRHSPSGLGGGIVFVMFATLMLLFVLGIWFAFASMNHVYRFGTSVERQRVGWLRGAGLAVVAPLLICVVFLFLPQWLKEMLTGRFKTEFLLAVLAYMVLLPQIFALAISSAVIQRGVLDPRTGFKRFTIWTVLSVLITLLFVLVERFVALKIVAWFQLPPDTGAVMAGAIIAITFVPLRNVVSKQVTRLAERWLPVSLVADGEQVRRAVAIIDLSGYTALAARDDDAARLQSATLKRAAQQAIDAHGGRIVKSLGDAVMLVFERPHAALAVVVSVHESFPKLAASLGESPLPLHSALHVGEVVVAHDGDIFGHTVNVTSRLVDAAKGGEIVLSGEAVQAAGADTRVEAIGARSFKNVPEPVPCFRLAPPQNEESAAPSSDQGAQHTTQ